MNTRAISISTGIVATIMLGWVLHVGAHILQPFVIAVFLCVLLGPVVTLLARWHVPPPVTVATLVILLFMGVVQVGSIIEANTRQFLGEIQDANESAALTEKQREVAQTGQLGTILVGLMEQAKTWDLPDWAYERLEKEVDLLTQSGPVALLSGVGQTGFTFVRTLLIIIIYMLFIFAEQAVFRRKVLAVAHERQTEAAAVLDSVTRGIQRYLGVKTITSIVTGGLCYLGLLWLDVPYALLWGFLTFLLNFIPTFGSIIAGIFPAVTALAVSGDASLSGVQKALIVGVLYLSVNLTLGSFLEPKILGRELNLSPLVIVVTVVVWAGIWGVTGAFLAVPITATLQIILADIESTRPIAILLSSGPPRPGRRRLQRRGAESGKPGNPS